LLQLQTDIERNMLHTTCPSCGTVFHSQDSHCGRSLRCSCGRILLVGGDLPVTSVGHSAVMRDKRRTESPTLSNRPTTTTNKSKIWARVAAAIALSLLVLGAAAFTYFERAAPEATSQLSEVTSPTDTAQPSQRPRVGSGAETAPDNESAHVQPCTPGERLKNGANVVKGEAKRWARSTHHP
jgi:hypothetical protein